MAGSAGLQRWLLPESGPRFLGWRGLLQEQSLPQKLEILVQRTSYNQERFEIRGWVSRKPCWYMVARSSCVHQGGGGFLISWSARGPRACAVSDRRGSGSFVGIRMT